MKRIIALMLIVLISVSLFACSSGTDETEPVTSEDMTETEKETTDVSQTDAETDPVTADPVTETQTEQITDTDTEEATETEPLPEDNKVYSVYDPTLVGCDYTGLLTLYDNGGYLSEISYSYDSFGITVHSSAKEKGAYQLDEAGIDLLLSMDTLQLTLTFDGSDKKETYLSNIKDAYLFGSIDGASYDILKKAASGGFSGGVSDIAESEIFGAAAAEGGAKAIIDKEENVAYYLIPGLALSDNEYYIPESGYTLVLLKNGVCRMYREDLCENDKGFGSYVLTDTYEGKYERYDGKIACTITQNTVKHRYTDEENKNAYLAYYEDRYSQGFLGKIYYDYYTAVVSDGGYTDDDMSDTYVFGTEEHTNTAVILQSPDSEM